MSSKDEIRSLCKRLADGHREKDANLIAECYSPDAVIYDLAPPLGRRGLDRDATARWLASWRGPIEFGGDDVEMITAEDIGWTSGYVRLMGEKNDGEKVDLWFRSTMCFRKIDGRWKIVLDHSSVPFRMDGSYRACTDLKPAPVDAAA